MFIIFYFTCSRQRCPYHEQHCNDHQCITKTYQRIYLILFWYQIEFSVNPSGHCASPIIHHLTHHFPQNSFPSLDSINKLNSLSLYFLSLQFTKLFYMVRISIYQSVICLKKKISPKIISFFLLNIFILNENKDYSSDLHIQKKSTEPPSNKIQINQCNTHSVRLLWSAFVHSLCLQHVNSFWLHGRQRYSRICKRD